MNGEGQRVHVNPTFPGYSVILQNNQQLEQQVVGLQQRLIGEQTLHRNEIRELKELKNISERMCAEVIADRNELRKCIESMEQEHKIRDRLLQAKILDVSQKLTEKEEEMSFLNYQMGVVREQVAVLNDRNSNLKDKCEQLVQEKKELKGLMEEDSGKMKKLEEENEKLRNELKNVHEMNDKLRKETVLVQNRANDLKKVRLKAEKSLEDKEAEWKTSKMKLEEELKKANEKCEELKKAMEDKMGMEKLDDKLNLIWKTSFDELRFLKLKMDTLERNSNIVDGN